MKLNNFHYTIGDIRNKINATDAKMEIKADLDEFTILVEKVRNMPRNEDLVDLYNKIVPTMAEYEKVMHKYDNDHKKYKKLIFTFDRDLAAK